MNAVSSWLDAMHAPDKLASTLRSRAPQAAVWVLALALGVQAALIVTHLAGAGSPRIAAAQPQAPALPARGPDVAAVVNAHLFGAPPVAAVSGSAADAPRTTMALALTATLAAHDRSTGQILPNRGLAILGPNAGPENVYGVGDNVPGGARLHAVYDDRVLLDRNGSLESLMLPRQVQGTATAQKANSLYLEQFKAGKRTVFEVLDSRMVVFTMQKNAVNGKYEQLRAAYGILRNMGRLVETAVRMPAS